MKYTIEVPKTLSAIKAKDLISFLELPEMDERQTAFHILQIFCKTPPELTAKLSFNEVNRILVHMLGLVTARPELQKTVFIEGVEYGFIPNLLKVEFGEFIDLNSNAPELTNELKDHTRAFEFLSICYRPIVEKDNDLYRIEPYRADLSTVELFREYASAELYLGAVGFFLTLRADSILTLTNYLKRMKTNKQRWWRRGWRSTKNTDGSELSTDLPTEIISQLMNLPNNPFTRFSPISNLGRRMRNAYKLKDSNEKLIQPIVGQSDKA